MYQGKEKLMSFGKYPEVSLALARERHAEARKLLATGIDPMARRKAAKTAEMVAVGDSFKSIASHWLDHWRAGKSPRHVEYVKRRLDADILPCLGMRPIAEIEAPELVVAIKEIEGRRAQDIAKRALETVGQVFHYAIAHGYSKRNPASDIRASDILKTRRKVNYARVGAKELPQFLRILEVYQGIHVTRLAMKLMALTFVRTSKLIGAKWTELDLENTRWDIPAERMKMRTQHIVPLSKQAIEAMLYAKSHAKYLSMSSSSTASPYFSIPNMNKNKRNKKQADRPEPIFGDLLIADGQGHYGADHSGQY
jgi:integrase